MSMKIKDADLRIVKGDKNISSVLIGRTCVYGEDPEAFLISYPAARTGTGFFIEVNGKSTITDPTSAGKFVILKGDRITVRTYALPGYSNPASSLSDNGVIISGTPKTLNGDSLNIIRATQYQYTASGDGKLTLSDAVTAPKVSWSLSKDLGISSVYVDYVKGPYEQSGKNDTISEITGSISSLNGFSIYYGSIISSSMPYAIAEEGFKVISVSKNYSGVLTANNQCTVTATSQAGVKVSLTSPAITEGIKNFQLTLVSSLYSKDNHLDFKSVYFGESSNVTTVLTKRSNGNYFYVGDVIRISAVRKDGYKYPDLGKTEDMAYQKNVKDITLSEDTVLKIESGKKGIKVNLKNDELYSGAYVYLNVESSYCNGYTKSLHPEIYVDDLITVPLNSKYRIGTFDYRKPGVGFNNGDTVLKSVTFTSEASFNVPNIAELSINLTNGKRRVKTSEYNLEPLFAFAKKGTYSWNKNWGQDGIIAGLSPESGYGDEGYFFSNLKIKYLCKRYLADIITSKYVSCEDRAITETFSLNYRDTNDAYHSGVLAGSYSFNSNQTGITLNITNYNDNWVADLSDNVKVYPYEIII